jgi:hypothetical protein
MSAFDDLHAQLTRSVADRAAASTASKPATAPAPRRRAGGWRSRPLVLALVGLTVGGSATAAAITGLRSSPAPGLETRLPPLTNPVPGRGPAADRYAVAFTPDLTIGASGWCVSDVQARGERPLIGSSGCNTDAVSSGAPVIARHSTTTSIPGRGLHDMRTFFTAVVDTRVAAVRLPDGRVLRPVAGPGLPAGLRSVVAVQAKDGPVAYLDRDGRPIRGADAELDVGKDRPEHRATVPANPAPWAIRTSGDPAVRLGAGQELTAPPRGTSDRHGRPFLAVSTARVAYRGREYQASYLLDAEDPAGEAAPLPGAVAVPGTDRVRVDTPGVYRPLTARREGPGWLVVRGPSPAGRTAVLAALRAGPHP